MFEVVIVKKLAVSEILKMMVLKWRFKPDKVEVFHAKHVSIVTEHRVHFQVDGEYLGKVRKVEATIQAGDLNLLVPADANDSQTAGKTDTMHISSELSL